MKICPSCNQQFGDDNRFCPDCQTRLKPAGSEERQRSASGAGDDLIGRVFFGEYTIIERLGEGGMGSVYLAEQNAIDQRIAIKVLHAESAESNEIIQRFHREAKVISMLTHPNIVRVFIFGRTEDDLLFLAMEHVDGVELREKMTPGQPLEEMTAIKIMKQVCSAVAEAHDLGIIHRDLKPENILLTEFRGEGNYVKILDFGIAKIKRPEGETGPQLTQAGIVHGTPEYLSPEQAQDHELDPRTDIYALGSILFEMVTGRVPFDSKKSVEILRDKVFNDPPSPSDHASVASTMETIIMKAMAKDREERYQDALEMFEALERREKEIEAERTGHEDGASFPGHELTGVHQAVDEAPEPGAAAPANDGGAPPRADTQPDPGGGGQSQQDASPPRDDISEDMQASVSHQADTIAMNSGEHFEAPAPDEAEPAEPSQSPAPDETVESQHSGSRSNEPGMLVELWNHRLIRYALIAMAAIGGIAFVAIVTYFLLYESIQGRFL